MTEFQKDQRDAFIAYIMHDDFMAVKNYASKHGIIMQYNRKIMAAGIYKAAQYCDDIPEEVKAVARRKCEELGLNTSMIHTGHAL